MKNLFKAHSELTEHDLKSLWEKAIFVFDTNVLLDLYRLPDNARKDLISIISNDKINNRIWIPFQVALEFTHNRLDAISDQKNKFNSVQGIIEESIIDTKNIYNSLSEKLNKLQLKKRHSVIDPDKYINEALFKNPIEQLNNFLLDLNKLNDKQPDVHDKDDIKELVLNTFNTKVGLSFSKEELETIFKEGDQRYKENIPPGYKDKDKEGFYLNDDKKIIKKYGDLLVWKEIINKAKNETLSHIILITGDTKEDWWQEKRGKKIGPRYELLNEIYFAAKDLKVFHIYETSGFMKHAKQYLKIDIQDQSIIETKDLLELTKSINTDIHSSKNQKSFQDYLNKINSAINVKLRFLGGTDEPLFLKISRMSLHMILTEILINVHDHSKSKTVRIIIRREKSHVIIKFKNYINLDTTKKTSNRSKGIKNISSAIKKYGFIEISEVDHIYEIKLFIENRFVITDKSSSFSLF